MPETRNKLPGYNNEKFIRQLGEIEPRLGDYMSDWMVANDASINQAKKHLRTCMQRVHSLLNKS